MQMNWNKVYFLLFFYLLITRIQRIYFHISLINMTALSCNKVYAMWHQHNRFFHTYFLFHHHKSTLLLGQKLTIHWLNSPFFQAYSLLYLVCSQQGLNLGTSQANEACLFPVLQSLSLLFLKNDMEQGHTAKFHHRLASSPP